MIMKTFFALGNDCPQTLVKLEDCVLQAIILISEGKLCEYAMDTLYSQLFSMERDLAKDNEALNLVQFGDGPLCYSFHSPTIQISFQIFVWCVHLFKLISLSYICGSVHNIFNDKFEGQWCIFETGHCSKKISKKKQEG